MCTNLPSPIKRSTLVEQCLAQNKAPGKLSQRQWHWRVGNLLKGWTGNEGETATARQKRQQKGLGRNFWGSWIVGIWVGIKDVNIVEDQIEKVGWNYLNLLPINKKYSNKFYTS